MGQEIIGLKITGDSSEAVKSVGSLKTQLRQAEADVAKLSEKFGATSKEAVGAAKKAAELRDRIGDAKSLTAAFNPDAKFKAFTATLSGVAGGFAAVQGAMGLIGVESENVQKTLLKVQSAMALSQGLQTLGESVDSFKQLGAVIKSTTIFQQANNMATSIATGLQRAFGVATIGTSKAFNILKAAIISTGIGALIVAIGTLIAYWDKIKEAVSGVSKQQSNLLKTTQKNQTAEKEKLETLERQDNSLKLQGKSEKDILNLKIKQTDEVIKATEENIKQQQIVIKAQIEAERRNKEILQGIIAFITAPLTTLLFGIDAIGKVFNKNFKLVESFTGGLANLIFDPSDVEKKGKETLKALDNQLKDFKEQRAGFQLSINSINANNAKKELEAQEILEKAKISLLSERQQKESAINKEFDEKAKKLKEAGIKDDGLIEKLRQKALKEIDDKYKKESKDREKEFLDSLNELRTKTRIEGIKDENEKARQSIHDEYEKQREDILKNEKLTFFQRIILLAELKKQEALALQQQDKVEAQKKLDEDLAALKITNDKTFKEKKSRIDQERALVQQARDNNVIDKTKYLEKVKELNDKEIALEKEKYDSIVNNILVIKDSFSGIATEVGKNLDYQQQLLKQNLEKGLISQEEYNKQSEELSKKKAIQERNLALFNLAIDTGVAIAGIVRQASRNPTNLTPFQLILDIAIRSAAVLANIFKARNAINQAKLTSASSISGVGGGGAAPIAPASPLVNTRTQLDSTSIQQLGSATNRAYVLESDVTNSQERIRRINRAARLV
ncbi:MAG: hypothetical protein FJY17_00940 [Bacteroidetes bacterium]|nr:hypothetical protein [Bacteroidota bacterium]